MTDISKLASAVPSILAETSNCLRKLASTNAGLVKENEDLRHALRVMKIARRMEERALDAGTPYEAKVARLQGFESEKLDTLEHAIELSPGGFKLGSLQQQDEEPRGPMDLSKGLEAFILNGSALG
jgi:hypothetical protein